MGGSQIKTDVCIIGGGLAGIVSALEILENHPSKTVTILDRDTTDKLGGLARIAFGGMALVDTPVQRRQKIKDSAELCLSDWYSFAEFSPDDDWPKKWADYYTQHSNEKVFHWLKERGIGFFPSVQWVERGLKGLYPEQTTDHVQGNSVPRYHILWGSSQFMVNQLIARLYSPSWANRLTVLHRHSVTDLIKTNGAIRGCHGQIEGDTDNITGTFSVQSDVTIVATGGIGGAIEKVRHHWPQDMTATGAKAPEIILNGCHPYGDGRLHDAAIRHGGSVTHLDKMWNYAAGIPHPNPEFTGHGLSLIPTRTSLWANHLGQRINKKADAATPPLITGFDTNYLCQQVARQEKPWTWHIMNWKIAAKELAISGAEHNPYIRDKRFFTFIWSMLTARPWLIKKMAQESDHIITANSITALTHKMNATTDQPYIKADILQSELDDYDQLLRAGPEKSADMQIRAIQKLREWSGDRLRTTTFKPIQSKGAGPFVAIKTYLISRKTLGGIQTDLSSRVLGTDGNPISGLYAVGEAAGFGGGGASGKRSLEGTFLPGCIMTAQRAAGHITGSL